MITNLESAPVIIRLTIVDCKSRLRLGPEARTRVASILCCTKLTGAFVTGLLVSSLVVCVSGLNVPIEPKCTW